MRSMHVTHHEKLGTRIHLPNNDFIMFMPDGAIIRTSDETKHEAGSAQAIYWHKVKAELEMQQLEDEYQTAYEALETLIGETKAVRWAVENTDGIDPVDDLAALKAELEARQAIRRHECPMCGGPIWTETTGMMTYDGEGVSDTLRTVFMCQCGYIKEA